MKSALSYVEETLINAEIVKLLPKCLAPLFGRVLSRCLSSHKTFFKSLVPATEQRIEEQRLKRLGHPVPERVSTLATMDEYELTSYRRTASNGFLTQRPSKIPGQQSASSTSSWLSGSVQYTSSPPRSSTYSTTYVYIQSTLTPSATNLRLPIMISKEQAKAFHYSIVSSRSPRASHL
jgi:hypothetical protein